MNGLTDTQILARLRSSEHNLIERKPEGVKPHELRQTLCAFANTVGEAEIGVLFIGLDDRTGATLGVNSPSAVQKRIADAASDCAPPIHYDSREFQVDGRRIIAVQVGHSDKVPHFSGPAWIREGDRSKRATPEQHDELIASRNSVLRRLLEWKHKQQEVMVSAVHKRLGYPELDPKERWDPRACRIHECDGLTVTFYILGSGAYATESISEVHFSTYQGRPAIQIRPRL